LVTKNSGINITISLSIIDGFLQKDEYYAQNEIALPHSLNNIINEISTIRKTWLAKLKIEKNVLLKNFYISFTKQLWEDERKLRLQ